MSANTKLKLISALTTVALFALPASQAFAGRALVG
jgi:hypothetical protein